MSAEADHQHETLKEAIRASLREGQGETSVREVQRQFKVGFYVAVAALEALEREGLLDAMHGYRWMVRRVPKPTGYDLALSAAEHGALLRGLDKLVSAYEVEADRWNNAGWGDPNNRAAFERSIRELEIIRVIRSRLKGSA